MNEISGRNILLIILLTIAVIIVLNKLNSNKEQSGGKPIVLFDEKENLGPIPQEQVDEAEAAEATAAEPVAAEEEAEVAAATEESERLQSDPLPEQWEQERATPVIEPYRKKHTNGIQFKPVGK